MANVVEQVDLPVVVPGLFWPDDEWTVPALRQCIGRVVQSVAKSECWSDGKPDHTQDGELEFLFHGAHPLKITTTHMYGVVAVPHPLCDERDDANRIEWRRRELSVAAPWSSLVGSQLLAVHALIKPDIGYGFQAGVSGLLLGFSCGRRVGYENWDYESGRFSFEPSGGVLSKGRLIKWMKLNVESHAEATGGPDAASS